VSGRTRLSRCLQAEVAVFVLAFIARISVVLTSNGLRGNFGYDASVYYSAADALTFGRLPYRDFVLLHPPGLMLVLTPFAVLGRMSTDHTGFVAGNLAFTALGAANAVLVMRVARAMNLDRRAAIVGGGFYAVWLGSVHSEYLSRLEPLGNFALLCGLLTYFGARRSASRYLPLVCGLAFGAAASVKIWWAVPLLIVLAWHVPADRRRDLPKVAAGAAVALLAIDGPFFIAAPSQMWHMVVTEQLGRNRSSISSVTRLSQLTGVQGVVSRLGHPAAVAISVLLIVVVFCIMALAWRMRPARVVVVLGAVQGALLMTAPSWFSFYSDYLAPAAALVLAAAVSRTVLPTTARPGAILRTRVISWVSVLAAAAGTYAYLSGPHQPVSTFPSTRLASAVRHTRCVMSDSPMGLILLDTLSKDLGDGCPNWIDVTGRTYGVDAGTLPGGKPLSRVANPTWQRDLLNYLRSGDAVMLIRTAGTGVSHQTQTALRRGGILATAGGHTIYHTPH
jgi:hypothetical protein